MAAAMNSRRLMENRPMRSSGNFRRHAMPPFVYPPRPCSHASEYVVSVGSVKVMLFMSTPMVEARSRNSFHRDRSALTSSVIACGPNRRQRARR